MLSYRSAGGYQPNHQCEYNLKSIRIIDRRKTFNHVYFGYEEISANFPNCLALPKNQEKFWQSNPNYYPILKELPITNLTLQASLFKYHVITTEYMISFKMAKSNQRITSKHLQSAVVVYVFEATCYAFGCDEKSVKE